MPVEVTLGGDRLGSGSKQKIQMHDYNMSSFNLEQDFKSSMAPGVLYPFIKMVGTPHGTFDIDLDTFVRTLPTRGPLFGSFKLQVDLFSVPFRLYQGILHNNPTKIGMKMNQVYLPKLELKTQAGKDAPKANGTNDYNYQVSESALLKYLGLSGIGTSNTVPSPGQPDDFQVCRKINAVPALAYYDIFKCYYSNKQEEKAYVITPKEVQEGSVYAKTIGVSSSDTNEFLWFNREGIDAVSPEINLKEDLSTGTAHIIIAYTSYIKTITDEIKELILDNQNIWNEDDTEYISLKEAEDYISNITWTLNTPPTDAPDPLLNTIQLEFDIAVGTGKLLLPITFECNNINLNVYLSEINLQDFDLENIDTMRSRLLSSNTLGEEFIIDGTEDLYPYKALTQRTTEGITWNAFIENGLVVKTYQSDLFNNWLDTEWIEGEEGIAALTAISTSDGKFTMDSFIFAEKLYDIYNRIATGGGTFEDWQESVYGEGAIRKCETPMYIGGMAAEIMFEEVISNSETKIDNDKQPLGSLAGKGTQVGKRGGNNIHVKMDEPGYVMGIVSITPRISYSQGNDWDLTELDTLDDLHKPGLDGIGFQDLIQEQMAWWTTQLGPTAATDPAKLSAGKQTAWINYQTAVDKCYGDFAAQEGYSFMVLNRNYEMADDHRTIKDLTTYIDPAKYNYAFAVQDLAAQNFWVQIHSKVVARRKMGAQQIPNL